MMDSQYSNFTVQEIRLGDVDLTRALFERAISLSHPPKKMKVDTCSLFFSVCLLV